MQKIGDNINNRRRHACSPGMAAALGCCLSMIGGMASAAHPDSSKVRLPGRVDEPVVVEWTGRVVGGPETGQACLDAGRFDVHVVEPRLPEGSAERFHHRMEVVVAGVGTGAALTDWMVTIVRPDGRTQTADVSGAGVDEIVALDNPVSGRYEIRTCAVGGATPQRYAASLRFTARPRSAQKQFFLPSAASSCEPPAQSLKFEQAYIDESRAGGEPYIFSHPDGHLLWGSHAGTTHFYTPTAPSPASGPFVENYEGQTYYYIAEEDSDFTEWRFVPRLGLGEGDVAPVAGLPATGFSDPEFAIDQAGNVFISEINLANVAVSKSTDGGRSYGLQNVISFTQSDRQWMAADREDELYMAASGFGGGPVPSEPAGQLGHFLAKSTDGGVTFNEPFAIDPIVGDIRIDQSRGILYSLHQSGGTLSMARFPNIREEETDFTVEILPIAENTGMSGVQRIIDPTFVLDREGNLYVTWSENGTAVRPLGVYYAYSTDQGDSWSTPQRVDPTDEDIVWPWIAVGEPGQVVITWLQTDTNSGEALPGEAGAGSVTDRLQESPDKPWDVMVAHSSSGLGCGDDDPNARLAAFNVVRASAEPPHTGTICQGGTLCQAEVIDRRLGDYFSIEVAGNGSVHVAVSDTRRGGAIALPLHIRQVGGPKLNVAPEPAPRVEPVAVADAGASGPRGGGALWLPGLVLLALLAGRRKRR